MGLGSVEGPGKGAIMELGLKNHIWYSFWDPTP